MMAVEPMIIRAARVPKRYFLRMQMTWNKAHRTMTARQRMPALDCMKMVNATRMMAARMRRIFAQVFIVEAWKVNSW